MHGQQNFTANRTDEYSYVYELGQMQWVQGGREENISETWNVLGTWIGKGYDMEMQLTITAITKDSITYSVTHTPFIAKIAAAGWFYLPETTTYNRSIKSEPLRGYYVFDDSVFTLTIAPDGVSYANMVLTKLK